MIILIQKGDGEKFCFYTDLETTKNYYEGDESNRIGNDTFIFNLESNERFPKLLKFEMKDSYNGWFGLITKQHYWLISEFLFFSNRFFTRKSILKIFVCIIWKIFWF